MNLRRERLGPKRWFAVVWALGMLFFLCTFLPPTGCKEDEGAQTTVCLGTFFTFLFALLNNYLRLNYRNHDDKRVWGQNVELSWAKKEWENIVLSEGEDEK